MERVNLGSVIEQAISQFSQNRIGDKPPFIHDLTRLTSYSLARSKSERIRADVSL
jgi:hypothetical protein